MKAWQYGNKCRHFTGIMDKTCAVGVRYQDVKHPTARPIQLPCLYNNGCAERCTQVSYYTEEEVAEQDERAKEAIKRYVMNTINNICPHCEQPIESKTKIGRCIYALPCQHRLYQGSLPESEAL